MAVLSQGQVLALRLLKHKIIRRAPATGRSRTQHGSEISRVSPSSKDTIPSTRTRAAGKRLEVRLDAVSYTHLDVYKRQHEARTDVSMLLGLIFLLLVGAGAWSLDAWLAERRAATHG